MRAPLLQLQLRIVLCEQTSHFSLSPKWIAPSLLCCDAMSGVSGSRYLHKVLLLLRLHWCGTCSLFQYHVIHLRAAVTGPLAAVWQCSFVAFTAWWIVPPSSTLWPCGISLMQVLLCIIQLVDSSNNDWFFFWFWFLPEQSCLDSLGAVYVNSGLDGLSFWFI